VITCEEVFELVGDVGEVGGRGRLYGRVWRRDREFGVLGVEIVEAGLEAAETGFAAFG